MQGYGYDLKPKRSNSRWYQCFGCLLFLLSSAAIAISIVVLVRQLNNDDENNNIIGKKSGEIDGKTVATTVPTPDLTTVPTRQIDTRQDTVVECAVKNAVTESVCHATDGYVFIPFLFMLFSSDKCSSTDLLLKWR